MRWLAWGWLAGFREPAVEGDVERVQGLLPELGSAGPAFAGRVQGHHRETDALQRGLIVREVPAGLDGLANLGVARLDRVRGANDPADLPIELQEWHELGSRVLPHLMIAGSFLPQASANSPNRSSACSSVEAW